MTEKRMRKKRKEPLKNWRSGKGVPIQNGGKTVGLAPATSQEAPTERKKTLQKGGLVTRAEGGVTAFPWRRRQSVNRGRQRGRKTKTNWGGGLPYKKEKKKIARKENRSTKRWATS